MAEVEPADCIVIESARLMYMVAQDLAQSSLQQMAGGMIAHDIGAAIDVDCGRNRIADRKRPGGQLADVDKVAGF